jgi:hypothetical protein
VGANGADIPGFLGQAESLVREGNGDVTWLLTGLLRDSDGDRAREVPVGVVRGEGDFDLHVLVARRPAGFGNDLFDLLLKLPELHPSRDPSITR